MKDELLQASETRFRRVIEANADGIVILNKDGVIRYANPAAEKLFGRYREALTGEIFGYPVVAAQTTEINIVKDVNEYPTVAEMRVVEIDWQNETAYLASLRDMTERKLAEAALQTRERFLTWLNDITRAALDSPDFQTMLQIFADRLGELFDADGCYITLWDDERKTAVPGAISRIIPYQLAEPGDTQTTMTASILRAKHAIVVDQMWNSPYTKTHTAELLPIQSTLGLPLIAGEQKLGAAFIIFKEPHKFTPTEIDQGERVVGHISLALAKAKLLKAEQQQRRLAETLSKVMGDINNSLAPKQVLELILDQLARIVAYDTASVLLLTDNKLKAVIRRGHQAQTPETDILNVDELPHAQTVLTDLTPTIISDTKELTSSREHAIFTYIRCWLGVPLIIKDKAIGLLSLNKREAKFYTQKDMDLAMIFAQQAANAIHNAQLYEQVQDHAGVLESRVAERTQKLREAYDQLKELDQLKSKFIDDISHELRTPLANLILYLDLMEKGDPANYPRYLNVLSQQTNRLRELVENILRLSHFDLVQDEEVWTQVDLNEVALAVSQMHQPKIDQQQVNYALTLHPSPLPVLGNFKQLVEMMTNLMENAIKYTPHGKIELRTFVTNPSPHACLQIIDSGTGIAAHDIPYIFDRFYRGEGASQSNVPGIGIGLTIAQSVASLHNGEIHISSEPDKGTLVNVSLPLLGEKQS